MGFAIPAIALGASFLGTGIAAAGAINAGQSAAAQARYQAQVAANNQIIAQQNATYARQAGEVKATDQAMRERATQGATRAALAASGMDINTGSAADVQEGLAKTGQVDVERTRQQAALEAYGYEARASGFGAEAGLDQFSARNDITAGFLKGGGTLLSGLGDVGGKWASLRTTTTAPGTGPYWAYGAT
jgi:hypothetical protein